MRLPVDNKHGGRNVKKTDVHHHSRPFTCEKKDKLMIFLGDKHYLGF